MGDASANTFITPTYAKTIKLNTLDTPATPTANTDTNTETNTDWKAPTDPGDWADIRSPD
jgi:hypothetical protein